ncbi:hypothetical protein ACEQ8H_003019 [Pleosporales sp. CAS-2024a]
MSATCNVNVLSVRDTNVQLKPRPSPEKDKSQHQHLYVSPSDEIKSPATQKLQAFKTKHAMKKAKPQTLFKTTSSKKLEMSQGTAMFADIRQKTAS